MKFLVVLFLSVSASAESAHEHFIDDLVDAFRKPFQEKILQIGTNYDHDKNLDNTQIRFYTSKPGACKNTVPAGGLPIQVAQILMDIGATPEQTYQNIEYTGCDSSRILFHEYILTRGTALTPPDLKTLHGADLSMALKPNENEKSYFVEFKGVRLFEIISERTNSSEFITRFLVTSEPLMTIYTKIEPTMTRMHLIRHSITHKFLVGNLRYRSIFGGGRNLELYVEVFPNSTFEKYYDEELFPVSKTYFDEDYNDHFLDSSKKIMGNYFKYFILEMPVTQNVVDTRGSTEFLNKMKEAYQLMLTGQTQNAQKIIETLIVEIESGKTKVEEKAQ